MDEKPFSEFTDDMPQWIQTQRDALQGMVTLMESLKAKSSDKNGVFTTKISQTKVKYLKKVAVIKKVATENVAAKVFDGLYPYPVQLNQVEVLVNGIEAVEDTWTASLVPITPFPEVKLPRGFSVIRIDPEIHADFDAARKKIDKVLAQMENRHIIDDKGKLAMIDDMAECMDFIDFLGKFKKDNFGEAREKVTHIDAMFRDLLEPLKEIRLLGTNRVNEYDKVVLAEAAKVKAEAEEAHRLELEKYEEEKAKAVDAGTGEILSPLPEKPDPVVAMGTVSAKARSTSGSSSNKQIQTYVVTDFALLSDRWKMVNTKLLDAAAESNSLHLNEKGLEIDTDTKTNIRRRKKS